MSATTTIRYLLIFSGLGAPLYGLWPLGLLLLAIGLLLWFAERTDHSR